MLLTTFPDMALNSVTTYNFTCFLISIFAVFPLMLAFVVFNAPLIYAAFACGAIFLFLAQLPMLQAKRSARNIDSELPLAALSTHCDLSLGLNPEKCLESVFLKKEFSKAKSMLSRGVPFTLLPYLFRSPSEKFKRFLNILCKGSCAELKKFYQDLFEEQRNDLKIFAAKASIVSMFFLVVSAVIPALFSALVLIGPALGFNFSSLQIILVYIAVFPLANYFFLFYLELTTPPE